jgi:putative transposase
MPRMARRIEAETIYHIYNRGASGVPIFEGDDDFRFAETLLLEAKERHLVRVYAYVFMPTHWHMVVEPLEPDALSKFVSAFTRAHANVLRVRRGNVGDAAVYRGRYKSFAIRSEDHLLRVTRHIERTALSARLVRSAEHWYYSSLYQRQRRSALARELLAPLPLPQDWVTRVNAAIDEKERGQFERAIRTSLPLGMMRPRREASSGKHTRLYH